MEKGKVSVIVPCYNQAQYLPETLDSVLAQTYQNWECVIVNDGSPDNTEEIATEYLGKDRRFKYLKQENKGLAAARNAGIQHSSGQYILPLDSDDLILPTYIEKAVNHFIQVPETKLVYCRAELFGVQNCEWTLPPYSYDTLIWRNCIFCSAIYRRQDYDATIGYNPNMKYGLEDWDFWLSLLNQHDIVCRIEEVLFCYRTKNNSMVTGLVKEHTEDMYIQLYKNHKELYEPYMENYKSRIVLNKEIASELHTAEAELLRLRNAKAYRVGKLLLKPLSFFKKSRP